MFVIEIADIAIGIDNRYSYVREISKDYISDRIPSFTVSASETDIECEKALAEFEFPLGILESTAIYRKIAEKICDMDAFIFHGAVIEFDGGAYLFTARSGVGKTTHIRLWRSVFGERVRVLNGDKPVIRIIDGVVYASGTPWRGKEGYGMPGMLPLKGIAFLERAKDNSAAIVSAPEVLMKFATQAYIPRGDGAGKTLSLFDKVLSSVPLISLRCNMDESAATTAQIAFSEAEKALN